MSETSIDKVVREMLCNGPESPRRRENHDRSTTKRGSTASKTTADKLRELTAKSSMKGMASHSLSIEYDDIKADLACVAAKRGNTVTITRPVSKEVIFKLRSVDCLHLEETDQGLKISWAWGK